VRRAVSSAARPVGGRSPRDGGAVAQRHQRHDRLDAGRCREVVGGRASKRRDRPRGDRRRRDRGLRRLEGGRLMQPGHERGGNPGSRIYQAPDATLFVVTDHVAIAAQPARVAPFRVVTPSARIALKLSLLFWQNVPANRGAIDPFLFFGAGPQLSWGLWLASADRNTLGIYASHTNLVGTIGPLNNTHTYQTIPVDGPT